MISRRVISALACFGMSAALLYGCVAMEEGTEDGPPIYYASQAKADAALKAFEAENPTCESWTNWQYACSRTGDDGETICNKSSVKTRPSTPFCMADSAGNKDYRDLFDEATPAQQQSFNRFCDEFSEEFEGQCRLWNVSRPFSSLKVGEMAHPWCKEWSLSVDPEVNPELSAEMGYYCSSRNIPDWCARGAGMGSGRQTDKPPFEGEMTLVLYNTAGSPIHFPYCRRRK